jgi:pyruvate dehydrogenase E1 component alpha subunit
VQRARAPGPLAVYPSSHGQEACQVAAVHGARTSEDWIFPTYRDSVAVITRGVPASDAMVLLRGDWHSGYDPTRYRVATQSTPARDPAAARGRIRARREAQGRGHVVLAMCGDGRDQ